MEKKSVSIREYTFPREGQEITVKENELSPDDLNYFYEELITLFNKFPLKIQKAFIYDIITNYERVKEADSRVQEPGQE